MKLLALAATAILTACTAPQAIIKPEPVPITKYVRATIPAQLLQPCVVAEPDPACWWAGAHAYCNGQLVTMILDYRAALQQCNADKAAISQANK